jgi:hypothetical protein
MKEMTLDRAKEQLRLAQEDLKAVGGKLPERPVENQDVTCEALYGGAAVLMWFAAQAALDGGDWQWYAQASQMHQMAAGAQGC